MADWWEWGRYWQQKREKKTHSCEFAENSIEWELPEALLPVRSRAMRWGYRSYSTLWYVNGSNDQQSFVYVLKEIKTDAIRYVGLTDDPPRRHMEHRRNNMLNGKFKMVVVAVGGSAEEREWIVRCHGEGCCLLNTIGNHSPNSN